MDKYKITLAEVIAVLTALAFGYVFFLGVNFYNMGDLKKSITFAVIVTLLLIFLPLLARYLKAVQRNFKTSRIVEFTAISLYLGTFLFSTYYGFTHYFTVSEKNQIIKQKLDQNIAQTQNMFKLYETYAKRRIALYKSTLQSVADNQNIRPQEYIDHGFEIDVSNRVQINNKISFIEADLLPTNYTDSINGNGIKEIAINWLNDAMRKVNDWKPIGIVNIVNNIENVSTNWRDQLIGYSKIRGDKESANDFNYTLSFEKVKTNFTKRGIPSPLSLGLALLAGPLMLLPWIITKRSSKVFKGLASYEIEL